jgi:SAM-dependent methyltransferase
MIERRKTESKSDAVRAEKNFHNSRAAKEDTASERLSYVYSSVADVLQVPVRMLEDQRGDVLEVGCYLGDNARYARSAHKYVGVDISDVAIERARKSNESAKFEFRCIDANKIEELGGSFDYVFGNGVLHHLDLNSFSDGLKLLMRPGSCGVFLEPMRGPFWLRWFRKLTPGLRTDDERPFDESSLNILRRHFDVRLEFHAVLRPLLPMAFLNADSVTRLASWLDKHIVKTDFGRALAWLVIITLRPKHEQ